MNPTKLSPRESLINHSNHGEFAYREGAWKLVFRMSGRNLEQSRGKPTLAELYNLDSDVKEQSDLSGKHPDVVRRMTQQLVQLIARGASRPGQSGVNDTDVQFGAIQTKRWGAKRK